MMKRIFSILTARCLLMSFALAEDVPATLSAVGYADVKAQQLTVLSCELSAFGPTVAEAQQLMKDQLYQLREVLKAQGVSEEDISSTFFDVESKHEYHYTKLTETELLTGYTVSILLQARIADTHDVGAIIDAIDAAGDFIFTPEACDEALLLAASEAMRKAGLLAEAGHVKLFDLIRLEESLVSGAAMVTATYTVK